jgi:hypothetical protein
MKMSKYTNLLDKIFQLAEQYRKYEKSSLFSEEVREYFSQIADDLELIIEEESEV